MTMSEWYCLYEHHSDQQGGDTYAGNLTRGDVDELSDRAELTNEEWLKQNGPTGS